MNAYTKGELLDVLASADTSTLNNNNQGVIDSLAKLTAEITILRTSLNDHKESTSKQVEELKLQLSKQNEIVVKQQIFLEHLDRRERECNIVILGVPDDNEALEGVTSDSDKVNKVWQTTGIVCPIKSTKRLGRPGDSTRRRPILVVVDSCGDRDAALEKEQVLKSCNKDAYKRIFIKKDVHPSVRAEWTRLHGVVTAEKARPENSACNIHLDFKARKVYKDGVIIDQWNMQGF